MAIYRSLQPLFKSIELMSSEGEVKSSLIVGTHLFT
jgi:hypothetical protein